MAMVKTKRAAAELWILWHSLVLLMRDTAVSLQNRSRAELKALTM